MNYYIDILLKPDNEMRENELLNKLYSKFHKVLFEMDATDIGVSFPKYHVKLGDMLRIHSTQSRLESTQAINWLGGLIGYCNVSEIQVIPSEVTYRKISRKQAKLTEARLRRLIKRDSISAGDVKDYRAKMFTQGLNNPYLELESTSNGNKYRRYLQFSEILSKPVEGEFDHFGLSKIATIPWF